MSRPSKGRQRIYRNTALAATKQEVSAVGTRLLGFNFTNPNTDAVYVKLYGAPAAAVTVGTTVPKKTIAVPSGDGDTPGVAQFLPDDTEIHHFRAGLTIAAVTAIADNGTTAPAAAIYAEMTIRP